MKLNLFTDYALRSLMYLSWHPDRTVTAEEIARYYGISRDHLVKVIQELGRQGYVRARRGRGGGSILARDPGTITIREVVTAFEGPSALLACLHASDSCVIEDHCGLRGVLHEAQLRMMEYLAEFTIADVAGKSILPTKRIAGLDTGEG